MPAPTGPREDSKACLEKPGALVIALALLERGPLPRQDLFDVTGFAASGALYHLRRLEKAGLVVERGSRRERAVEFTDPAAVARLLDELHPGWRRKPIGGTEWRAAQRVLAGRRNAVHERLAKASARNPSTSSNSVK